MCPRFCRLIVPLVAVLWCCAGQTYANIYMDEGFEGTTPFTNRNWPTRDYTSPPTPAIVANEGVNLRTWGPDAPGTNVVIGTQQGTVDSSRAFQGTHSYRLDSGQRLAVTPGAFPARNQGGWRMWQFAASTDAATAAFSSGTQVARFKIDYSKNSVSSLTPDLTVSINFVTNGAGGVSIQCANNGAVLGTLDGASGQWRVITVLAQDQVSTPSLADSDLGWAAHDPLKGRFIGPKPANFSAPDPVQVRTGMYLYVNDAAGNLVGRTLLTRAGELGFDWQYADGTLQNTSEIGWEFSATNGGKLYLDDLYWDSGVHGDYARGFDQEQAARANQFGPPRELLLHGLFRDNMVLQRQRSVPVFGGAEPGTTVTVRCNGQTKTAVAAANGVWTAHLDAMEAGGPYELTVDDGSSSLSIQNVMLGEVWLCSGQSNMVWKVSVSDNAAAEIAAANWPRIRVFTVPFTPANSAAWDVAGQWEVCSPATAGNFSAVAYYFGRGIHQSLPPADIPIGLIVSAVGATRAEDWTSAEVLATDPDTAPLIGSVGAFGVVATTLYYGMIAPLIPYEIRGAIWYQGESNANNPVLYRKLFPMMINCWRTDWGSTDPQFPFLYVQLPNYSTTWDWPGLREAQFITLAELNTAMAVTIDAGTAGDIHPTHKQVVGERLAIAARGRVYGEPIEWSGPLYTGAQTEGSQIRVFFQHFGSGLIDRNGGTLDGFKIAGSDMNFVDANAGISGSSVVVWSPSVPTPAYVRYAWASNPPAFDLANVEGLLASPFRTDGPPPPPPDTRITDWELHR